jgi:hypothetical protein
MVNPLFTGLKWLQYLVDFEHFLVPSVGIYWKACSSWIFLLPAIYNNSFTLFDFSLLYEINIYFSMLSELQTLDEQ